MQDFDNIKDLWQKTSTDLPSTKQILDEVEKARKKMMRKNILGIIMLTATFIFISWIGIHYNFEMWTTRAGVVLTLLAIVMGVIFMGNLSKMLTAKADGTLDNASYLAQLKKIQHRQRQIQTTGIGIYFIMLSTGLILYMIEFAVRDLVFGMIAYAMTALWIAFAWFYLRKRTAAKQEQLIAEQIARIENLISKIKSEGN